MDLSLVTVADLDRDPYPLYRWMRANEPVGWVPAIGLWLVTRWDDVEHVAKHPDDFTAEVGTSPVERCFGQPTIITTDGEVHRDLRRAIDPKYRPARVNEYIDGLVRPHARDLLDDLSSRGRAELLADYFEPISTLALARSMGFVDQEADTLRRWFRGLSDGATNFEEDPVKQRHGDETAAEVREVAHGLIDRIEASPDGSALASMMFDGVAGGGCRARDLILPTVLVTLLGGMQEPGHGAGSVTIGLLDHPTQLAAVLDDASLIGRAVDEGLRWMAPIGTQTRQTTAPVELGGAAIPADQAVAAVVASACHDEGRYERPDVFDLFRAETEHAAFGFGAHFCSGHWFARQQIRIALEELLDRLPGLRYAPGFTPEFRGWEFRAPVALHVEW